MVLVVNGMTMGFQLRPNPADADPLLSHHPGRRFQVLALDSGPYPVLPCLGSEAWALVWHMVYTGCIRIPDFGPILRAHGLGCRPGGPNEEGYCRPIGHGSCIGTSDQANNVKQT